MKYDKKDVDTFISIFERVDEDDDLNNISSFILSFERGYYLEIRIDGYKPYLGYLYNEFHNNEFLGIFTDFVNDLNYYGGLKIDDKYYNFIEFEIIE